MRRLNVTLCLLLAACAGGGTTDETDPASETDGTTDGATAACVTRNEDCEPGSCGGEGSRMLPGSNCVACHAPGGDRGAPTWSAGGTVFQDVDGTAAANGATVRILDANDKVVELVSNTAGNFYTRQSITFPITAEIEVDGEVVKMETPVESGGCNECHACEGAAGGKLHIP